MPSSQEGDQAGGFWDRFFHNSPQKLQEEIHRKLNANPPRPHRTIQDEMEDMLKAFGLGDLETTTTTIEREFETSPLQVSPFATAFQRSSYQIHQDDKQVRTNVLSILLCLPTFGRIYLYLYEFFLPSIQSIVLCVPIHSFIQVQVQVDAPGVSKEDLKVEVVNMPACVVQWSGHCGNQRTATKDDGTNATYHQFATFSHRLRLGSSVDCEKLSANLSRGVLRMTAPIKKEHGQVPEIRAVPISDRED
jgi:HSP20 family molecular chaperone IbpA